jgi:hypothetical protein
MIEPAMGKLLIHLNVIDVHAAEGNNNRNMNHFLGKSEKLSNNGS